MEKTSPNNEKFANLVAKLNPALAAQTEIAQSQAANLIAAESMATGTLLRQKIVFPNSFLNPATNVSVDGNGVATVQLTDTISGVSLGVLTVNAGISFSIDPDGL